MLQVQGSGTDVIRQIALVPTSSFKFKPMQQRIHTSWLDCMAVISICGLLLPTQCLVHRSIQLLAPSQRTTRVLSSQSSFTIRLGRDSFVPQARPVCSIYVRAAYNPYGAYRSFCVNKYVSWEGVRHMGQ